MGALLCCFRIRDHEEDHTNDSGDRVPLNGNLSRKREELLRNRTGELPSSDQSISSSQETEQVSSSVTNPSQKSKFLTQNSQTINVKSYDLSEDDDVCAICLEDYTDQNPRIHLRCGHEFHLGCIYEWMERSAACPFCDKMMLFSDRD